MKINENLSITKRSSDDAFYGEKNSVSYVVDKENPSYNIYEGFYNTMRATPYRDRAQILKEMMDNNRYPAVFAGMGVSVPAEGAEVAPVKDKNLLLKGLGKLLNFFTEFSFVPSFRFTNTLALKAVDGYEVACAYVRNYFSLMDSSYKNEVSQKIKSAEFKEIVRNIAQYGKPETAVNARLKIYFGPAGTGKTVQAEQECENRCIVCNSSMLPSDLMEDFIFKDGNPDFNPSVLWNCMEQGTAIVLDEINLLPFDSLRFLQGITDGKTEFCYKNRTVHIKDGFQIVGTMNLSLGGMTYGLPEPLVDRCSDTKEFTLTAEQLAKAITGWGEGE